MNHIEEEIILYSKLKDNFNHFQKNIISCGGDDNKIKFWNTEHFG